MVGPRPFPPQPPDPQFPARAVPGRPPPPLPPEPFAPGTSIPDAWGPVVDPALDAGLAGLVSRPARLRAAATTRWSVASLLHATAPLRHTPGPDVAFLDESLPTVTVAHLPLDSLPDAPPGVDLLSRLRMVHRKLLPDSARHPRSAGWATAGGHDAVLDLFTPPPADPRVNGFSLAAAVGDDAGLLVVGWSRPDRSEVLRRVALPLGTLAHLDDDGGLVWAALPGWRVREELQVTTATTLARAELESLPPGWGLPEWTAEVFDRAPFLRDRRSLGERAVQVRGVDDAWMSRFDWQPSGRGRTVTTVVTGIAGSDGFSFAVDVPLGSDDLLLDPDALLGLVEVRPDERGEPLPEPAQVVIPDLAPPPMPPPPVPPPLPQEWPVPSRIPTWVEQGQPPPQPPRPPLPRSPALYAAVDRVLVAAVDVVDAAPAGARGRPEPGDPDGSAVDAALSEVLRAAPGLDGAARDAVAEVVRDRLTSWLHRATSVAVATLPGEPADVPGLLWAAAAAVAFAAAESRRADEDHESGLSSALAAVRHGLDVPDAAWDEALTDVRVARPPRYRLRAFFDPGSGTLLWSANDAARERWDYPVDHFDLPVPLALARRIETLVDRYDSGFPDTGYTVREFSAEQISAFRAEFRDVLDELRPALGSAYEVVDEAFRERPAGPPRAAAAPLPPLADGDWTDSRLRVAVPAGWTVKESYTVRSPGGQAVVLVWREPLSSDLTTERYAETQHILMRREFSGFEQHDLTEVALSCGPALLRTFSWTPPDGVRVTQRQLYFVSGRTAYTATATATSSEFARVGVVLDTVLRSLELTIPPLPPPAPPPPPFSPPPPPPPPPPVPVAPDPLLVAVDRVLVAAIDVIAARTGRTTGPADDGDRRAVDTALGGLGTPRPGRPWPWQDGGDVEARVRTRVAEWGELAGAATGATPPTGVPAADLVWWTAGEVVAAAATDDPGDRLRLAEALGVVLRDVDPAGALWKPDTGAPAVWRPRRFLLQTVLDRGSGQFLRTANEAAAHRWGPTVDAAELPVPESLVQHVEGMLRWFDAGVEWRPGDPIPVRDPRDAFADSYRFALDRLRAALGPAYEVQDTATP